jgi:hypothetical protein
MISQVKMIIAGNIIHLHKTGVPFYYGYEEHKRTTRLPQTDPYKIAENRGRSIYRAIYRIGFTIHANHGAWFKPNGKPYPVYMMTNTFQENVQYIKFANQEYIDFLKRFNYLVYGKKCSKLRYLKVIEFQERGAVHFHNLLFNLPFVPQLYDEAKAIWPHGSVNFVPKDDADDARYYVTKYLTKDIRDERLVWEKSYSVSRGLIKPAEYNNEEFISEFEKELPQEFKKVDETHKSEYYKTIQIQSYVLPKNHPLLQKIK